MKAKFGSFIVAGSGKIGGHVASKNRGGAYLRTKVTPLNPNSAAQAGARGLLSSLAQQWRTLTQAQRDSFSNAVAQFATTDIFGDLRNPSGINLFVKLNSNLVAANRPIITMAPPLAEIPYIPITDIQVLQTDSEIVIASGDNYPTGTLLQIQATPELSAGITFIKNRLRTVLTSATPILPSTLFTAYENKHGSVSGNGIITFGVRVVAPNGVVGPVQIVRATTFT